jgi:hypothetical protein
MPPPWPTHPTPKFIIKNIYIYILELFLELPVTQPHSQIYYIKNYIPRIVSHTSNQFQASLGFNFF